MFPKLSKVPVNSWYDKYACTVTRYNTDATTIDDVPDSYVIRTRSIKLRPTKKQQQMLKNGTCCTSSLLDIASKHKLPHNASSIRLAHNAYSNKYYITYSIPVPVKYNKGKSLAISIDPGKRTFATTYDTWDNYTQWSNNYLPLTQEPNLLKKVNRVDALHNDMISWLCRNYQHILLPRFVDGIYMYWSFIRKLKCKSKEYIDCNVHIVSEAYTSKYCSICGKINVGDHSKMYHCKYCGLYCDRDINSACNIMIKHRHLLM